LEGITSYEVWYDKNPNVEHLRVFIYLAHARIYLSYEVMLSRDVIFYEGEGWDHQKLYIKYGSNGDNSSKVHHNYQTRKVSSCIPIPSFTPMEEYTSSILKKGIRTHASNQEDYEVCQRYIRFYHTLLQE